MSVNVNYQSKITAVETLEANIDSSELISRLHIISLTQPRH